jgi:hypothetical protein
MQRIIHALIVVCLVTAVTACALGGQDGQSTQSDELAQPTDAAVEAVRSQLGSAVTPASQVGVDGCTIFFFDPPIACPSGSVCLYQNNQFGGEQVIVPNGCSISNLRDIPCPGCTNGTLGNDGTFNDQMSSWKNFSGRAYCYFFFTNFQGTSVGMGNGQSHGAVLAANQDRATSIAPGGCP